MKRSGKRSEMFVAEIDERFARTAPDRIPSRLLAQGLFEGRPPMTRGRALDSVTRSHLELVAQRWPRVDVDRPIFIVGIGRSGTTLLGRILAAGRGIGYLKEPKAMWATAVPDEDISGFYGESGRFVLTAQDATDEIARQVGAMYNWYGFVTRSTRIVDKYPEMTYRVPFLRALFPDAKIVAIVRRPDAVARSIVAYSKAMADDRGNWWGVDDAKWSQMADQLLDDVPVARHGVGVNAETTDPLARAKAEWLVGAHHLVSAGDDIDEVIRFEELLADPEKVLTSLCKTVELPSDRIVHYGTQVVGVPKIRAGEQVDPLFAPLMHNLGYEAVSS